MPTRMLAAGLAAALGVALLVPTTLSSTPAAAAPPAGQNDAIVHLFEWNWNSVANECTTYLAPKGYGAVQVSPPQEHIVLAGNGYPWWQDYQPISYKLQSRRGDRAAFAAMVSTCNNAGVKVYVDAVLNHMQGTNQSGTGSAGSGFSDASDPAVPYSSGDFHSACPINYSNADSVRTCQLSNLWDLRTETDYVRSKEAAYLNDLISLGVSGFRLDAAKHMYPADIAAIQSKLTKQVYWYQEVIEGGAGEVSPTEYTGTGDVTDFRYGDTVGNAFRDGNLANLNNLPSQMIAASDKDQVFIDNHDTERNGRTKLNYKSGDRYFLAEAFMLAYPFGTPSVMSGFTFSSADQGPPANSDGSTKNADCSNGWTCQHRDLRIANMVGLRNAARGTSVTNWWSNGGSQIAFGRGSVGYVVFNTDGGALSRTFQTSLPAGTYCDVENGSFTSGTCSGTTYTVSSSGTFTATVGSNRSLALYTGARVGGTSTSTPTPTGTTSSTPTPTPTVSAGQVATTFSVNATTTYGQNVYVVGSIPALGSWNPANAVALSSASYPVWTGTVNLPAGTAFEYKYVKKDAAGNVTWESTGNRAKTSGPSGASVTYTDAWSSTSSSSSTSTPTPTATVTPTPTATSTVSTFAGTFAVNATTTYGQNVYVVGSIPALGSWNPANAVALSSANYPAWRATVNLPAGAAFEYKYVKKDAAGNVTWESGANRVRTAGAAGGSATYSDTWS